MLIFESLPLFLLSLFWPPPFQFIFLCLSLVLFFLFFLLVFFAFFGILLFVSFFPFVSSLFLFHERNNIKTFNCNFFVFINLFSFFFVVSWLAFSFKSLFLVFVFLFPDFKLYFLFNMNVFGFKANNFKKTHTHFGQEGGCNKTFFLSTCVL